MEAPNAENAAGSRTRKQIIEVVSRILTPFAIGFAVFFSLFFMDHSLGLNMVKIFSTYAIPVIGPVASVGAGIGLGVHPAIVVFWLTTVEVCGAMLIWLNSVYLEKLPKIGRLIQRAEHASRNYLVKHPWAESLAIAGLAVFVLLPIQGTGPLVAPILGRILGMKMWEVLLAVAVAAAVRFGALATGFTAISWLFL